MSNGESKIGAMKDAKKTAYLALTFVILIGNELKAAIFKPGKRDKVDYLYYLDQIGKAAAKCLKEEKIKLGLNSKNFEIEGTIARVEYSERPSSSISPRKLYEELDEEDFFASIKVSMTDVKKVLPESRISEISEASAPVGVISFKAKK